VPDLMLLPYVLSAERYVSKTGFLTASDRSWQEVLSSESEKCSLPLLHESMLMGWALISLCDSSLRTRSLSSS